MKSRIILFLAIFSSGVAALSWEVIWQLQTGIALGVSAWGAALTLVTTMLGLGTGALIVGPRIQRYLKHNVFLAFALCEIVVALSGAVVLFCFELAAAFDTRIFVWHPELAPLVYLFSQVLIVGVPAVAMGATVPLFGRIATKIKLPLSLLYGVNTFGGALGCLLVALLFIPALGVQNTTYLLAVINAFSAGLALLLMKNAGDSLDGSVAKGSKESISLGEPYLLAFLTGFATLALEVAWFRAFRGAFRSTTESFALMLCAVLVALAIGARLAKTLESRGHRNSSLLFLAALGVLFATPLVERLDQFSHLALHPVQLTWFALIFIVVGPPLVCLGTVLPRLLDAAAGSEKGWGRLYAFNTIGAALGGVLAAWLFLPKFGFSFSAIGVGVLLFIPALLQKQRRLLNFTAVVLATGLSVTLLSGVGVNRVVGRLGVESYQILEYRETPDAAVAAIEFPSKERGLIIDGFHAATELNLGHYMRWMGHLPMLIHPQPERALVICFGTGQTANAVRQEGPQQLTIVDLNAAVFGFGSWFPKNERVLDDPRVKKVVMDGRSFVRRSQEKFDAITLEPMPPNFAGVNNLYSLEFYKAAKERLNDGGTIAQWVTFRLVSARLNASVVRTFLEVFPQAFLWVDPISQTGIVVGRNGGKLGESFEWPGFARPGIVRDLSEAEVRAAIALEGEALARYAQSGQLITDNNQALAYGSDIHAALINPRILEDNLALVDSFTTPKISPSEIKGGAAHSPEVELALRQIEVLKKQAELQVSQLKRDIDTIRSLAADKLVAAAFVGDLGRLAALLAEGAELNRIDPRYNISPLSAAASRGQVAAVEFLVRAGADINFPDRAGFTPLMNAALNKQLEATRLLLKLGADPKLLNIGRQGALGLARARGYVEIAQELEAVCSSCK